MLCGHPLPWVHHCKHLGNYLDKKIDGLKHDLRIKQARYIDKNNELEQEFYFCHPQTKFKVNKIYNSHFTGSPLWNLFSPEAVKVSPTPGFESKGRYIIKFKTRILHFKECPDSFPAAVSQCQDFQSVAQLSHTILC